MGNLRSRSRSDSPCRSPLSWTSTLRGPIWQAVLRHNLRTKSPLNVTCVGDSDQLPLGADDAAILKHAEREQRIVVTQDRRTMPAHLQQHLLAGNNAPGVLIVHSDARVNDVIDALVVIAFASEPSDFANLVAYMP